VCVCEEDASLLGSLGYPMGYRGVNFSCDPSAAALAPSGLLCVRELIDLDLNPVGSGSIPIARCNHSPPGMAWQFPRPTVAQFRKTVPLLGGS
jgi:hypothetical protein